MKNNLLIFFQIKKQTLKKVKAYAIIKNKEKSDHQINL
jgi:hypothetical protein